MLIFLNDRFVPKEEAAVSVFDHGFLYGDGVYETLRAYGGRFFMLNHPDSARRSGHLDRARSSDAGEGLAIAPARGHQGQRA